MIKKRLEHAVFLMGMLFITLLTSSANAFAQGTYTVTVEGGESTSHIQDVAAVNIATNNFTLVASDGYTLPTTLTEVKINDDPALTLNDATDGYTYVSSTGVVKFGSAVILSVDDAVTIKAVALDNLKSITAVAPAQLTASVASAAAAETLLNAASASFAVITDGGQTGITLPVTWKFKTGGPAFDPADGGTNNYTWTIASEALTTADLTNTSGIALEGDFSVLNKAKVLSTVTTLSKLTYKIGSTGTEENIPLIGGDVKLPIGTAKDAEITITAEATSPATIVDNTITENLVDGALTVTITVTAESGATKDVVVTFSISQNTSNSLTTLTYTAGTTTEDVTGFKPADAGPQTYTVNTIPFGTKTVSVKATAAQGATVKDGLAAVSPFTVTLNGTTVVPLVLTVTSESGVARTVTINFSAVQDKITSVTPPVAPTLDKKLATAAEVIALLPTMLAITTESESVTELPLTWALKTNTTFTDVSGKINIFTWTATSPTLNVNGKDLTGDINVINALVPETGTIGDITVSTPAVQFGDGSTPTTAGTITVDAAVKELTFNKVTVNTDVTIPAGGTTTISLQGENSIAKITNAGNLTLKNATSTRSTSSIATRAVANTGAVKVVENTGTFTDETGTILTVSGSNSLEITTLPTSQLNITGQSATLTVVAAGATKYQWKKNGAAVGTDAATLTVNKADGAGSYICEVSNAGTNLMTPAVTVSFQGTTPPPVPEPTYYAVSLPAVTGAKFSKTDKTAVIEGGDFAFQITLDKDYNLSVPVVKISRNNEVITAVAGVYTVSNVRGDLTVTVTGITKNIPTGIDDVNSGTRIWAAGSTLHIFTEATENVYVFNASGVLQKQFRTPGGDYTTQMNEGLYIVKIGNYTQKVIIK